MSSEPRSAPSSSPFVVGVRQQAETERKINMSKMESSKLNLLEKLIEKIVEFDRLVLKKTAPETTVPQRRGSRGSDLSTLPTHLHLTDRLLDLFTQSQRVTVIRTTVGASNHVEDHSLVLPPINTHSAHTSTTTESNPADKKLIESLRENVAKLTKQLEQSDTKKAQCEEECNKLKKEVINANVKIEMLNKKVSSIGSASADSEQSLKANSVLEKSLSELEQRMEIETSTYQSILAAVLGKASRLNSNRDISSSDDCFNLPSDMQNAFKQLEAAIAKRLRSLQDEIGLLSSVKELLEGELGSANLQRELVSKDLTAVSEAELLAATRRNVELARSPPPINMSAMQELENKLRLILTEKSRVDSALKTALEELDSYKKLTEKLKLKIRDMGAGSKESRDFLDTFEEVMRDEMSAMKAAFEMKLRVAKEEADATTRRHQQEIARIQTTSPYR
eukprot:gene29958-39134_t